MKRSLYRYATLACPAGYNTIPMGGMWAYEDVPNLVTPNGNRAYSIVDYSRRLTDREIDAYSFEFLGKHDSDQFAIDRPAKLDTDEFWTVLVCAERYACGRRTYMPGLVTDYIMHTVKKIPKGTANIMLRDIDTQRKISLGDPCDEQVWTRFQAWLREQTENE